MQDIRLGTLVNVNDKTENYVRQIIPYGFESFSFIFSGGFPRKPAEFAEKIMPILKENNVVASSICLYLCETMDEGEAGDKARDNWRELIDSAHLFDCNVVCGFTGRLDKSIPDNIERFKEVWTPLTEQAAAKGVKIGFENCNMGGSWGRGRFKWTKRFVHIHGKDATIHRDTLAKYGIYGTKTFAFHRTPGFGDSNWTEIISELRRNGFKGSIDIEGWHDPVYRGELEMTGQVNGLNYLKRCRGDFYPNPA